MLGTMAKMARQTAMRQDLANALANLSSIPGHEEELVLEGGLEVLRELIGHRDLQTRTALARSQIVKFKLKDYSESLLIT